MTSKNEDDEVTGMMGSPRPWNADAGWGLIANVLSPEQCEAICTMLASFLHGGQRGGQRNLFAHACIREIAQSSAVRRVAAAVLGEGACAVRAIAFDKVEIANWRVPWHRDRVVAVRERRDAPGFSAWSVKAGIPHAEAPRAVLDRMLAIRLHLDASTLDNGPLRILPGSHRDNDDGTVDESQAVTILAPRGSALLMRPRLRHASSPAEKPQHRRVLHLEFAAENLPGGLEWFDHW